MRNPFSNSQMPAWMRQRLARFRDAMESGSSVGGGAYFVSAGVRVLVVCALLIGTIAATRIVRQRNTKTDAKAVSLTAQTPRDESVTVDTKAQTKKSRTTASRNGSKPKVESVTIAQTKTEATTPGGQPPVAKTIPIAPVVMGPPVDSLAAGQGEKESSDIARLRGSWFFDQRAFPNKHIPEGALQKAIEERDAMRNQQRAAFKPGVGANAIINFPGDALWHLMGPQPIDNSTFGMNGGAPTASGRITAIAVDPTNTNIIYVGGAAGGVWKTTDGGTTWTPLTDSQSSLAVGSIAIDPNNHLTIYVGTGEENFNGDAFYGEGILKSTDGGNTWAPVCATLGSSCPFFGGPNVSPNVGGTFVGAIAIQPGGTGVILAAMNDYVAGGGGIFRSTNGGASWTQVKAGVAGTDVVFDPGTPTNAYAAMGYVFGDAANGIYKSTDGGATWSLLAGGLPTANLGRITLGYARSTTGSGATIYAAIADSSAPNFSANLLGLFKTTNGGTTWTSVTGPAGGFCNSQCFYDMAIGVHPTNPNVVVLGGGAYTDNFTSLFESQNGGTSWTPSSSGSPPTPLPGNFANGSTATHVHVDTHAIVFTPTGGTLFVGNDGGIWSTNTPTPASGVSPTWNDLNGPLALAQFYPGPSAGISDENLGFGGTQDNDIEFFNNALQWTNEFICGDGGFTAVDKSTPSTVYAGCNVTAGAKVRKAVFGGQFITGALFGTIPGFDVAETAITNSGDAMQFIPPLANDDGNQENLYFGTCRVWATRNAASSLANTFLPLTPTWNTISGDLTNGNAATAQCTGARGNIAALEVAHSNSSVIVAGTTTVSPTIRSTVWESTSGGVPWMQIDAGALPNRTVTAVRTKRNDSTGNIVYVTLSGFGACAGCGATPGHVFKSTNAASGAPTWTNISGDLPDIPVNDIIVDHNGNPVHDALYIATDVGVFACPDPEAATPCTNWTVIGDGLPNSPVLGLTMRRSSRILHAATHGRSMWEIQLTDVNPPALAALSSITPAAVNVVIGGAGTTALTITGLNFSNNTQVQFDGATTGVTTAFANTTQLNVTLSNTLLQVGGVHVISLTDPAGVDSGSALLAGGGGPFAVMNPLVDPTSMTPITALTYTAVPFHLTSGLASEPFLPNTVLAFYDTTNTILQFQLPIVGAGTVSSGGTVYDYTTPVTQFTTPATYHVVPYNPAPGGTIDPAATTAGGGPVPFTFTVTANPGPLAIFNPNPIVLGPIAVGANTSITTFQIQNPGTTNALNITNATLTGTNAANFVFVAPTVVPPQISCNFESTKTVTVGPGVTCIFGIKYTAGTPPGNANSVATLNVTDNAPGSPQPISVTGEVLTIPSLVALTPPLNFGAVAIGATSATMDVTLVNATASTLNINSTGFTIGGVNNTDFAFTTALTNPCPALVSFALAAGANCDVGLHFTPSIAGTENATISVADDGPGSPQSAPLTGIGVQITSISPSIVQTGGPAFTLTVVGGGFAPSAVVNVGPNGTNPRLTTFVSANQLLASIPASDIATAGSLPISVTTPVPGGTPSEPKTLVVAQAFSATNDNINFATAITATPFRIAQDTTKDTPNTGGINDPSTSCGSNSVARSVWFSFKAPATGRVVADTRFSTYTTILSAWTGTPGSLVAVAGACATGNITGVSPAESFIGFSVTSGTTYFLMVTDASGGAGGTLTFSLDFASAVPANDPFSSATAIASAPFSTTENTILATANTGATDPTPSCAPAGAASGGAANSVWFKFTAPSSGTITADTLTSPYDTILTVVTGAPGSFTQVACNDNATVSGTAVFQSEVPVAATSGTTYFFMVSSVLGDGGTTNFHLTFSGAAVPSITFAPTSVSFGNQQVGIATAVTNVQVTNSSGNGATLHITAMNVGGTNSSDFILSAPSGGANPACAIGNNPTTIAQGASCFMGIKFNPGGAGARSATLNVSDDAAGSPQSVPLSGTGTQPSISFTPTTVSFGNQQVGIATAVTNVQVTNNTANGDPLHITAINVGGTNAGDFTLTAPTGGQSPACPIGNNPITLAQGASCFEGISFNPGATGARNATLNVADDAAGSPQSVVLSGTGTQPSISFTPTSLNFGNQTVGVASAVQNVQVTNNTANGNPLHITAINVGGANAGDFTLTAPTGGQSPACPIGNNPITLAQGASCFEGISFNPGATGARSASMNVADDAAASPQSVPLSGTGVAVSNPVPTIASFSPANATAGGAAFTLTINGTNFVSGATGIFNGAARTVTFVSATQVTMAVTAADIAVAGSFPVVVSNPAPGGGPSTPMSFPVNNPAATLTSLSPSNATAGGPAFTLTINGSNFVNGATGTFNGNARTVTFVSAAQVTMAVTAPDIATAGSFPVVVSNPAPVGGSNGALSFTVNNVVPTLTSISPTSATVGGAAFTLTLNGTNFVPGSTVKFGTSAPAATFVSSTQLTAAVPAAAIATAGAVNVTVSNPAPGGGTSGAQTFSVNNPVPTIASFAPASATAGGAAFTLTINGTNFVSGATGTFNGTARTVTFVSATQVSMAVTAADIATGGTFPVIVSNPGPGGGASAPSNYTVNNAVPTISSLSPSSATAGGAAFTLTVNGSGFVSGSSVKFNGNARTTTFVSTTQVTAAITAADIAAAGTFGVTVTNPAPGGGTSTATNFTVNNPVPTITSFAPASATAGGAAFTLTINGSNFVSTTTGTFNSTARTVTFVSSTQVTMAITVPDIATAGTFPVVLTNPAPGGGPSAASNYTVNNPAPTISTLSPNGATAGGPAFTLTMNGTGFVSASSVKFNGNARTTTFVSASQLTAAITAADIASTGSFPVTVTNPVPGGGTSTAVSFNVSAANNPVPTLTSVSPTSATAGGPAFTLTATGTNFVASSVVNFNNAAKTTTFVSATQVTASITAADIASGGVVNVTVTNPAPGGGTTSAQSFTINNPVPTITSLSPANATAGGSSFTLTVNGTGFVPTSGVKFNGNARSTTFVSATQVTASITPADIATAGTFGVTVTNPAPAGGTSAASNFTVNNPVPTISSLAPISATAGGPAFTLTVNGTNFVATSGVNFNGAVKTTTFVSATQVTAAITAADIATAGTFGVTVTNPGPGGGTSAATNFTVNNPGPTITTLSPTGATAGGAAFTLTVNGTGFVSASVVKFNGNAKTTTFVSATQVTAAITAADIATSGSANVTVTNPTPGGGTSGVVVFNIASAPNPVPTLTSISPTTTTAGGAAFTLTVNGTNYVSSSVVNFNGSARTTTVVSGTQLTASITAADIAAAGSFPITVFNPAPGGGTSSAINLAVNNPVPSISSLSPASATFGSAAFTLTINGSNFVSGATGTFNGIARTVTFVSSTQVTMAVTAADLGATGSFPVVISNPAPGGGASAAAMFAVNNPVPTITTLSQNNAIAGGASFPLTINGTNYVPGATVNFGTNPALIPTTITAGQIQVIVPAADIATAGNVNVTVTNPAPGGGTSAPAAFTINNPAPTITTIAPTSATAGGAAFTLTVTGTNFVATSVVNFNGAAKTTTFVSATQVTAAIAAADIATAGVVNVTVSNPVPGGGTSAASAFTINNPAPTITTVAPTSANAGGAAFTLTVNGTNFVATSVVNFNGAAKATTFVSATQVTAAIAAADIATAGVVNVTVTNPAPGGGTSGIAVFTINNAAPTITTIAPTSGTAGGAAFTLTVNGTGFLAASKVNFNGAAKTTTFVSSTQITAAITAADIATAGIVNVTVTNPAPGGGTSSASPFTINNPAPVLASLSPSSANVGGAAFALTVMGTGFVNGAAVQFNGANRTTTFVSATQLTAAITAADVSTAGTFKITVINPTPTVGPSNQLTLSVNNPVPTISTVNSGGQTHVPGGAAFTLTVTGTNFVSSSVINFAVGTGTSKAETTTFVSATQLTASIPASDVATAGAASVIITNPSPGGGITAANTSFTIDGYAVSGPSTPPTVKAGKQAMITITVTPTANGFANAVAFAVAGLPKRSTASFSSTSLTPGTKTVTTTLTVTTTANSEMPPAAPIDPPTAPLQRLLPLLWLAALLVGGYSMKLTRRVPQLRRYAALVPLALLLITGAVMAGCAGKMNGTPTGTYQLTVTGTSGTLSQSANVKLTVD